MRLKRRPNTDTNTTHGEPSLAIYKANGPSGSHRQGWKASDLIAVHMALGLAVYSGIKAVEAAKNPFKQTTSIYEWTIRHPQPTWVNLNTVAFANGRWAAIGSDPCCGAFSAEGAILTSEDAQTWDLKYLVPSNLTDICYGENKWVAVGRGFDDTGNNRATIFTSEDAHHWSEVSPGSSGRFEDVHCADGIWVAVGLGSPGQAILFSSEDASEWVERVALTGSSLNKVNYYGGTWTAVGHGRILESVDAKTWHEVPHEWGNVWLAELEVADGLWIAAGDEMLTKKTGGEWSSVSLPASTHRLQDVRISQGRWIAVGVTGDGNGLILGSDDGLEWKETWRTDSNDQLVTVRHSDGNWVAIGESGIIVSSTDGISWHQQESGTNRYLHSVSYGAGRWTVLGCDTILTSSDTRTWEKAEFKNHFELNSIRHHDGLWIGVGTEGHIVKSEDAAHWDVERGPTATDLTAIAFGDGRWVIIGQGGHVAFESMDGQSWSPLPAPRAGMALHYAQGLWVAVEYNDIVTSTDARTWTKYSLSEVFSFDGVTHANNLWIAVGSAERDLGHELRYFGAIATSRDGANWETQHLEWSGPLEDVHFQEGKWVAVGRTWQSGETPAIEDAFNIAVSTDGIEWHPTSTQLDVNLHAVERTEAHWIAVGDISRFAEKVGTVPWAVVATSTDSIVWETETFWNNVRLNAIARNDEALVAVGNRGAIVSADLIQPLKLAAQLAENSIVISWPESEESVSLQSAENPSGPFEEVTAIPRTSNGRHEVSVPLVRPQEFFRLEAQPAPASK